MTATEEQEMHALAEKLEQLTRGTGWQAMRYGEIGRLMQQLVEYCAVDRKWVAGAPPGLYRIFWKSGGMSLAAVGMTENGQRWLAPVNWLSPSTDVTVWEDIARVEVIEQT